MDKCIKEKLDLKALHRAKVDELKQSKSKHGADFCNRQLSLSEARVEELTIELDICEQGDIDTNFADLKSLFDQEKKKFDDILKKNEKEMDYLFEKQKIKDDKIKADKVEIKKKKDDFDDSLTDSLADIFARARQHNSDRKNSDTDKDKGKKTIKKTNPSGKTKDKDSLWD